MDLLLNNLDLIAGSVICGLFFMLGFFMSSVRGEKRHFKVQERQMREEIIVAKKSGSRSSEDTAEFGRLRAEVTSQLEALKQKDTEIAKLIEQLNRAAEDYRKLEGQLSEPTGDKGEMERLRAEVTGQLEALKQKDGEIEKLIEQLNRAAEDHRKLEGQLTDSFGEKGELGRSRAELNAKIEAMASKEQELNRLQEERRGIEERVARADKILTDFAQFDGNIHDQMKDFYDIEQRIREIKIKLRVLTEKAKEGVELIAGFAEGKEFEEFRKSIHLDEMTQKYEDQIKDIDSRKP